MGKSLPSPTKLQDFARIIGSNTPRRRPTQVKPVSRTRSVSPAEEPKLKGLVGGLESPSSERRLRRRNKMEEESSNCNSSEDQRLRRIPLADVVADCVRRWFQDTLKEAKAGDTSMQVLVGQMYFSGYGVPRDAQKVFDSSAHYTCVFMLNGYIWNFCIYKLCFLLICYAFWMVMENFGKRIFF